MLRNMRSKLMNIYFSTWLLYDYILFFKFLIRFSSEKQT